MAWSVLWTLVPLLTCGIGTPAVIGHAARRLRSPLLAFAAVVYGVGIGVFMVGASIYGSSDRIPVWLDTIGAIGLFGSWIGGLVHAVILRESVFRNPQADARPLQGFDYGHARTPYPAAHPVSPAARPPAQWQSPRPHTEPPRYGGPQGSQTSHGARPHDRRHDTNLYDSGPHGPGPYDGSHGSNPYDDRQGSGPYDGPHGSNPYDGPHGSGPYDDPRRPRGPHGLQGTQGLQRAQGIQGAQGSRHPRGPAASTPPAGTPRGWLGPYRLIGELGKGGQGKVYLALTPQGQKVAIKVLHEHFSGDRVVRERFLREVEATRRVATFSTARVLDVNITEDQAYVVSEYVEGVSLEQLVRDRGPRDEDGLTRLALATAGALAAIHRAGVVHRDFKPANVLIGADGPRVIDFGIARALDQVTATSGKIMGTPAYMSPEQLAGEAIGTETDVFSWAATMLFAASGRAAFGEDTIPAILNRVINHHPDLSPMPPSLRSLAAACLDKLPANRPTASDIMLRIVH
jgi:predicted Ser/Thr protein kinase